MTGQYDRLLQHLPDLARWVETRAILMRGQCRILGEMSKGGAVIVDQRTTLAAVVGKPQNDALDAARLEMQEDVELLVMPESLDHVKAMLPHWEVVHATLHTLKSAIMSGGRNSKPRSGIVLFEDIDDDVLGQLSADLRHDARHATVIAAKRMGDRLISACYTNAITESLWDVGIVTSAAFRRQGHARDCYRALAGSLARQGKQPTWGAIDTNTASLAMARSLGFVPIDKLSIFFRKADDHDRDRASARPQPSGHPLDSVRGSATDPSCLSRAA